MLAPLHRHCAVTMVLLCGMRASLPAQTGAAPARVQGVVFDSIANRPLAGAMVQLVELPPGHNAHTVITDSLGRFQMDSVRPGSYVAGFLHPLLDSIGIEAPDYRRPNAPAREGAPRRRQSPPANRRSR